MGMASGCGEQEVGVASGSGWNLWVWLLGVVVRKYVYRFPHTTYPYSSCICSFLQQHPYLFVHLKKYNCEQSELSGLFNGTDFLYISGRTSCRKCFHVILNIRSIRLALICNTTHRYIYIYISQGRGREKVIVELAKQLKKESVDFLNV